MPNDRKPRIKFSITARHEEVTGSCLSCAFIFQDGERFNFLLMLVCLWRKNITS